MIHRKEEVACYRIKLKPNSHDKVKAWSQRLNSKASEVQKLIKAEGISVESAFLEKTPEGDFLIYYVRGHDLKKSREISQSSTHPLDIFHRNTMAEISESGVALEALIDFTGDTT